MSKELDILIGEKTVSLGDKAIIISKPKWKEISIFIGIIESLFDSYFQEKDDFAFAKKLLADGGTEITGSIEKIMEMCLRKNAIDNLAEFLAELDYDFVISILFEIIQMNSSFFKQGMEKIGLKTQAKVIPQTGQP